MFLKIESTKGNYRRLIGDTDGVNKTFQCQYGFHPNTDPMVYLNGVLQNEGDTEDFVYKWGLIGKIEFNTVPSQDESVTIAYYPIGQGL